MRRGMARFRNGAGAAIRFFLVALAALAGCGERGRSAAPNVLLLTLDTTRPDRLGCYGSADAATPALDRLAREGVLFERATTVAPLTLPAHASLMTGLLPPEHGVRNNAAGYRLREDVPTLAEAFRARGYATAAVVASFVLDARFGLARGFDRYDGTFAVEPGRPLEDLERKAPAVAAAAARAIEALPEPFFLWVHFYDPHAPYEAGGDPRFAARPYDAEIAAMDRGIAAVLDALGAARLDRTVTIAVGDHGEAFGEHGEEGHGHFLYEPTIRVPLLVRAPAGGRAPAGVRVAERVSIADVAATALDLAGVPRGAIGGTSLAPLVRGERAARRGVFAETRLPFENHGWSPLAAWIEGEWKLVAAPRPELYDLAADPGEAADRSAAEAERARSHRESLAPWTRDLAAPKPRGGAGAGDVARGLGALGYVSGGTSPPEAAGPLADPKDTVDLFVLEERARAAKAARRFGEAERLYADLAARSPGNARARNQLGSLALARRDAAAAEKHFREAIAIAPDYVEALNNLGTLLERTGRIDDARAAYRRALAADPDDASVHHNLGALAAESGDLAAAESDFREVVRCLPGSAGALADLASVLEARGKKAEARAAYERALAIDPAHADARAGATRCGSR